MPAVEDVYLLIEVADSSLRIDRGVKLPLYASAGVPEVWIVNLADRQVEVYRRLFEGRYQSKEIVQGKQEIVVPHFSLSVTAEDLLGK